MRRARGTASARAWRTCPMPERSRACASHTPTSARFSMRSTCGALVLVVPTVDTVEEAREAVSGRISRRSAGAARWRQCIRSGHVGQRARRLPQHDQRQPRADTDDRDPRGSQERRRDREGARRHGSVRGEQRSRQLLGLPAGRSRLRACDQYRARRGDQGRQEALRSVGLEEIARTSRASRRRTRSLQIGRGARAELGDAHNTQAKPEVGPFAPK